MDEREHVAGVGLAHGHEHPRVQSTDNPIDHADVLRRHVAELARKFTETKAAKDFIEPSTSVRTHASRSRPAFHLG